jgi:putative ABC transport system ATP-binding protein
MSGLLRPSSGHIEVAGSSLSGLSGKALDRFRGRQIGIVFQRPHFVASLTVLENLLLPAFLAGTRPDRARALSLLTDLGVGAHAARRPRELSIGEQQRVGIARALVHRPAVVFADEPTSALDDRSTEAVVALLERAAAEAGATLVIVTHDARLTSRYPRRIDLTPAPEPLP